MLAKPEHHLLDAYDVYLDNVKIESLPHATNLSKLIRNVTEGEHTISFRSADDPDVRGEYTLDFKGDSTFQCTMYCHGDNIDLDSVKIIENVDLAAINVPDLSEAILSTAENSLKEAGFVNVTSKAENDSIWDSDNWIVLSQEPEAGTTADKNQEIILTCTHTDEYLKEYLDDVSLLDVPQEAETLNFDIHFVNAATDSDMDSRVESMSEEEKGQWRVTEIEPDSYGERKANLKMTYFGERNMPDLIGTKLSEALKTLGDGDFTSVVYKSDSGNSIWDNNNWYIISQSVDARANVPANEQIDLIVRHKDDIEEDKAAGIDPFSGHENSYDNIVEPEEKDESVEEIEENLTDTEAVSIEPEQVQEETEGVKEETLDELEEEATETIQEEVPAADSGISQEEIITVENNEEFAKIMVRYDYWSDDVEAFANKYQGRMIAFPAHCTDSFSNAGDEQHLNIAVSAGDSIQGVDVYGPAFLCRDTTLTEFIGNADNPPSTISIGDNLYFTGIIDHYENDLELFILRPVSANVRNAFDYSGIDSIKMVQESLNAAGYDCGTPDGMAGANTKNAISKFREANALLPGDYIDWALVTALSTNTGTTGAMEEATANPENTGTQSPTQSEGIATQPSGSNGIELFRSEVEPIVQDSFGSNYSIAIEDKIITIKVWTEGVAECHLLASEGDQEAIETLQSIKSSCDGMADSLYSRLLDYDPDAHLVYCIMNEYNLDNVFFAYLDGEEIT